LLPRGFGRESDGVDSGTLPSDGDAAGPGAKRLRCAAAKAALQRTLSITTSWTDLPRPWGRGGCGPVEGVWWKGRAGRKSEGLAATHASQRTLSSRCQI